MKCTDCKHWRDYTRFTNDPKGLCIIWAMEHPRWRHMNPNRMLKHPDESVPCEKFEKGLDLGVL